jgi:signal transduction histidine kinase
MNSTARENDPKAETNRLKLRLKRERATRLAAESIAEKGLRELYNNQQHLLLQANIAAAANETTPAEEVLQYAIIQICEFMGWEVGHSYLTSGSGETLRLRSSSWHVADSTQIAKFQGATEEMEFYTGVGLPGRVLATGQPQWVFDITDDDNFPRLSAALECDFRGAAAFPVFSGQEVVGVLEFFTHVVAKPNESLLELMSQIGLQLGRTIERQRARALEIEGQHLRVAKEVAEAANRNKSEFLTNMSHELRTPLNAVIGFSDIMKTESFGPLGNSRYRGYADDISYSGRHLLALINDILDMSTLEAGQFVLCEETVDLAAAMQDCLKLVEPQVEKLKLQLSISLTGNGPLIRADGRRMRQILLNVLSNAVKFTQENGRVSVASFWREDGLAIAITDTGIGMTPAGIVKALQPFGQVDSSLSRKYAGTGLGLPIAKQLIEMHGGTLTIESQASIGTTVTILVPDERVVSSVDIAA